MKSVIQIFRAGVHRPMEGAPIVFSSADLDRAAKTYNEHHRRPAPLVIGHPVDDRPAYGHVHRVFSSGGELFAEVDTDGALRDMVRSGRYKKVSAAFHLPNSRNNPVPGAYFLKHVGFLGAMPPAVKGMADPEFADGSDVCCFADGTASGALSIDLDRPAVNLIESLQHVSGGRLSFYEAARALGV